MVGGIFPYHVEDWDVPVCPEINEETKTLSLLFGTAEGGPGGGSTCLFRFIFDGRRRPGERCLHHGDTVEQTRIPKQK